MAAEIEQMSVNRITPPPIDPITDFELLDAEQVALNNGINLHLLPGGDQEVISLQIIFPAGRWHEDKALQSLLTSSLLKDGTSTKTSKEVNELLDFYGAHLKLSSSYDFTNLQLVCLNKHLEPLLLLLSELLDSPRFDEEELEIKQTNFIEKLKINEQKTSYLAQRLFHEKMFGKDHPYGYSSDIRKYKSITTDDLKEFFQNQYNIKKGFILLSGNFSGKVLNTILKTLEQIPSKSGQFSTKTHRRETEFGKFHSRKENAQQASIRIGMPSISIQHPDFQALHLLNTVLGGYFGSRLMSNLREDKGFTYGAYSFLGSFLHQGYFYAGTDVGVAQADAAVEEIYKELQRLQTETIPEDELQLVKNYLMGKYLAKIDGPFSQAKVFRSLLLRKESTDQFVKRVKSISFISANRLQQLAQQYFNTVKMVEVVV